jgi:two-component system, NtrC family, sensor histidine kinase HydH
MLQRHLLLRVAGPTVLVSILLLGLCTATAVYLYRQQATTAHMLDEHVVSRKIDHELETAITDLIAGHRDGSNMVDALHERIHTLLTDIQAVAHTEEERRLVRQLVHNFTRYRQGWDTRVGPAQVSGDDAATAAVTLLETELLPLCHQLQEYHSLRIEHAAAAQSRTVHWMAWGLASVGSIGALAGLILGYSVARRLRHSIYQLSVRIQDAAGKLRQPLPTVILTADGDLHQVNEQMQGIVREIERVVAQLQQREREVLRADQLVAVGQMAAGVAHELRNPLTSIKMLVQANREEAEARGLPAEDLQIIEQEIRRMERCLQTFLDFARPPQPERHPVSLAALVERMFILVEGRARKQHVTLHFTPRTTPVIVEADADQMQQLLVNLALNALDAMPQGGSLDVSLGAPVHGQVELRVHDTGPGIAPALLPRLFEPFVSSKETGLGLGLVVSRRIAESHGGNLWVTNPPHGGACFVLHLPVVLQPAVVSSSPADSWRS